jgi:hypothetical protein
MSIAFSFSLQGLAPNYYDGIRKNAEAIATRFTNATMLLYTCENIKDIAIPNLTFKVIKRNYSDDLSCHFWRFEAVTLSEYSHVCVRDIDSTVSDREVAAIHYWIKSTKTYHCMRDHECHSYNGGCPHPILGGMWGAVPTKVYPQFKSLLKYWLDKKRPFKRYADMWFLNRYIYPYVLQDGIQHDSQDTHWGGIKFPTHRIGTEFVGAYDY